MEGWGWKSVHEPSLLDEVVRRWSAALAAGEPFEMEFPLRRADGVFRWYLTRAVPLRDDTGRILRWFGTNTDVDDAKRDALERTRLLASEQAARKAADVAVVERTKLFMDAPAAVGILRGPHFVIELANSRLLEVWGRTPNVIGTRLLDAVPELRGQKFDDLLTQVMHSGEPHAASETAVKLVRHGRLETVYFNFVYAPARSGSGEVDGVAIFAFEVTAQVVARDRATLAASVGRSLVTEASLSEQLGSCCEALVALGAAFARIWTYNANHEVLELRASAGIYTHLDGGHARVPLGSKKIGRIAQDRTPHLTNTVVGDPRVAEQEWAKREGMVAFAGYPLVVNDRLVGVMALFAKQELSGETLAALAAVADQIALGIERDSSERFRELFIGMLGHDLRNPLNAVTMAAHMLLTSSTLVPQQRRIVERVKSSAARMNRMIAQVLDFTRARSGGGIPIERASSNIHQICAQAIDELASSHPERIIDAEYLGEGRGSWDADRLAQVFSNLVSNAIAYGLPETPVRVIVDSTGADVRCSVHNMGAPIPETIMPMLFDPFRRANESKTNATQGLGLGLFISQQIVLSHGGTLSVQSSAAEGTRFTVTLPKRPCPSDGVRDDAIADL